MRPHTSLHSSSTLCGFKDDQVLPVGGDVHFDESIFQVGLHHMPSSFGGCDSWSCHSHLDRRLCLFKLSLLWGLIRVTNPPAPPFLLSGIISYCCAVGPIFLKCLHTDIRFLLVFCVVAESIVTEHLFATLPSREVHVPHASFEEKVQVVLLLMGVWQRWCNLIQSTFSWFISRNVFICCPWCVGPRGIGCLCCACAGRFVVNTSERNAYMYNLWYTVEIGILTW